MKKRRSERRDPELPTARGPRDRGSAKLAIVCLAGVIALELVVVALLFTGGETRSLPDPVAAGTGPTSPLGPPPAADEPPREDLPNPDMSAYEPSMTSPIRSLPQGRMEPVTVYEVLSGDTLKLEDDVELRMIGIQAPAEKDPLFDEAVAALSELIRGKRVLAVSDEKTTDRYDRRLAYLYVDGVFINGEMVRLGYAYAQRWGKNTRHARFLKKIQDDARYSKRGLWSLDTPAASFYLSTARARYFHRPDCRLIGTGERVRMARRSEAFDRELVPCRTCKP